MHQDEAHGNIQLETFSVVQVADQVQGMTNLIHPSILIQYHSQGKIIISTHLGETMMAEDEISIFSKQQIHSFILKVEVRLHW